MCITVIAKPSARHQVTHQQALIDGLKAQGIDALAAPNSYHIKTKAVACWGWKMGKRLRAQGHDVLVMERGYLGDRFKWTSLAWNGLNGHGQFPQIDDVGDRFNRHFELSPWQYDGDYILVMGQVPGDESLQGRDLLSWYAEAAKTAQKVYKKPVLFRPHPEAIRKGYKQKIADIENCFLPLRDSLKFAHAVVTFNSNSAVDAVIQGVPAIVFDKGTMAWDVAGKQIGQRIWPCRQRWAAALAWKQWSMDEIATGFALTHHIGRIKHGCFG
jgi:hypothetical protein